MIYHSTTANYCRSDNADTVVELLDKDEGGNNIMLTFPFIGLCGFVFKCVKKFFKGQFEK